MSTKSQTTPRAPEIECWIAIRLGERLAISESEIDRNTPLSAMGFASRDLVELSGDLEEWLGIPVCPTIAWEFPTVALLARQLERAQ